MQPYLEQLIRDNISTADAVAVKVWKTAPYSLELDELKSVAYLGLVSSAARWETFCEANSYNPESTEYFSAYAIKRMNGAIYDHFRSTDWATRALRQKAKLIAEAGEVDSEEELMEKTGLSQKQVRSTQTRMSNKPVPLEEAMAGEYEPKAEKPTSLIVDSNLLLTTFVSTILKLSEDQQSVIILKYFEEIDLKEIARRLGMSDVKVSHLHTDAVLLIHEAMLNYLDVDPRIQ